MFYVLDYNNRAQEYGKHETLNAAKAEAEKIKAQFGKHSVIERREVVWTTKTLADLTK